MRSTRRQPAIPQSRSAGLSVRRLTKLAAFALTVTLAVALGNAPATAGGGHGQRATLAQYLADTYASLEAMTNPNTGLPADNIEGSLDPATASGYTSPTNIGGWLWSTVVARDSGLITEDVARDRLTQTLTTLEGLDRNQPSGMFYNWYDPATGKKVAIWPTDGNTVQPFLSSVDNAWLAASLRIVANAEPALKDRASALYDSMRFDSFYDAPARQIRGGFWDDPALHPTSGSVAGDYLGTGTDVWYTGHHYDTTVSETRIALYLGIANGQIPPEAYYSTWRTFPSTCDWKWAEQRPSGVTRTYLGINVYEGAYAYKGMAIVPGWGGSMFEALMPDLFVPEAKWGPKSWGVNHPLMVRAQEEHGLNEAGYGYWGFSPASNPNGGYSEYGVDALGMRSDGYMSDGSTDFDGGFYGCRDGVNPTPAFGDGVVTPHASFLALPYDTRGAMANLANIKNNLNGYGPGGFYDAVSTKSGKVAERYLSLDQAMIVAAIGNQLDNNVIKGYFVDQKFESQVRPLLAAEEFGAHADPITPTQSTLTSRRPATKLPSQYSGTGEPGAHLTVQIDGSTVCTADVAANGSWTCAATPGKPDAGRHTLTLSTINDSGISTTGKSVNFRVDPRHQ